MKKGDKIKCVRAPEKGIPIKEGETYIVSSSFKGNQNGAEICIEGMEDTPGVTVEGAPGYFTADRFELVKD